MSFYKDEQVELDRRELAAVGVSRVIPGPIPRLRWHIELTTDHGRGDVVGVFTTESAALQSVGIPLNPNRGRLDK